MTAPSAAAAGSRRGSVRRSRPSRRARRGSASMVERRHLVSTWSHVTTNTRTARACSRDWRCTRRSPPRRAAGWVTVSCTLAGHGGFAAARRASRRDAPRNSPALRRRPLRRRLGAEQHLQRDRGAEHAEATGEERHPLEVTYDTCAHSLSDLGLGELLAVGFSAVGEPNAGGVAALALGFPTPTSYVSRRASHHRPPSRSPTFTRSSYSLPRQADGARPAYGGGERA